MIKTNEGLQAVGVAIDNNDVQATDITYDLVFESLDTEIQQKTFRQGVLAMTADVAGMRLRRFYHRLMFVYNLRKLRKQAKKQAA